MIKAVIFDADGVLINAVRFSKKLEKDRGISSKITAPFFEGPFSRCLVGDADLKEEIAPYLPQWGWDTGVDAFLTYWFVSEHVLNEALIAYVQELRRKGIVCIVATNQEKHRAEYMLQQMGFADSFDNLHASAHIGHKKPSNEFYEKVFATLRPIDKKEVLFWDDDAVNVAKAREFGINAELYTNLIDFKQRMHSYL